MNLYSGAPTGANQEFGLNIELKKSESSKLNPRVKRILDRIPDYGFMLDTKLALPQTMFME
jgi:hypothetical protein